MMRVRTAIACAILLPSGMLATGCTTMEVKISPSLSGQLRVTKRLPAKVGLLVDEDFDSFHHHASCAGEMSKLDFDLGTPSKHAFLEMLAGSCRSVVLVRGKPPYKPEAGIDVDLVLRPSIVSFDHGAPAIMRTGTYDASIEYGVSVWDRNGHMLLDKSYHVEGHVAGRATHSPGENFARPVEQAIASAMRALLDDLTTLSRE